MANPEEGAESAKEGEESVVLGKSNILMLGPTGSGMAFFIKINKKMSNMHYLKYLYKSKSVRCLLGVKYFIRFLH